MIAILGAGITGLSAAVELRDRAVVFEKESQPGGLVRSFCFDGFWYDKTVHFLMLGDLKEKVFAITGDIFKYSPLEVWVETKEGAVRYPFQLNLGGLSKDTQIRCIADFCRACYPQSSSENYKDFLLNTFGEGMCNEFFFPYNEKNWKYPLDKMTGEGTWNIHRPTIEEVLEGAFDPNKTRGRFNTDGYYPAPQSGERGIGLLSKKFAEKVFDLNLDSEVVSIDAFEHTMTVRNEGINTLYKYENLFSTIPLPKLMGLCVDLPAELKGDIQKLKSIKMTSMAVSVIGDRPKLGHYRYYTDPEIPFNKVVFMTEFDTYSAPPFGFGLLLELKETAPDKKVIIESLKKVGILKDRKVVDIHSWVIDPAYVVFTKETKGVIDECKQWLFKYDIVSSGRYGNWEYSSMAENIKDGFDYALSLSNGL